MAARRRSRLTTAIHALGQRSMSLYLFQSIVFVVVFYPYGFGLQDDLGLAGATEVATATWLVSLLIADFMRRVGYRGPAEILLRRLAYRQRLWLRHSPTVATTFASWICVPVQATSSMSSSRRSLTLLFSARRRVR
ncbi:MAG: DUF418 domain-containing protein [Streptosporangiales bacterium]|nr:DUF418 domain-containing protein [Streptosporangiales bacterium]